MNRSIRKNTFREITGSFGRYLAIFAIIALGVGFFSGLKVTKQAMVETTNNYLKDLNMYDFMLVSTLGLEENDPESIMSSETSGLEYAEGAYRADAIVNDGNSEYVIRFHSVTGNINTLSISAGRTAQKSGEVVADARYFPETAIGQTVVVSDNNTEETLDCFNRREFTIVGLAHSPLYLNYERGATSVGSGSLSGFYYILPEDFNMEVYTEIFISLKDKEFIYSDSYHSMIDSFRPSAEKLLEEHANKRYDRLHSEAEDKLYDAKKELDDAYKAIKDAKDEIETSQQDIDSARRELEDKQKELDDAESEINIIKADPVAMTYATEEDLMMLKAREEAINSGKEELKKAFGEIDDAEKELENGRRELADKEAEYEDALKDYDEGYADLEAFTPPSTYTLTRDENIGYACFENDSDIVEGIAVVFPVFFFLVAALVCVTTMSRMIEEQRTQIGVLKALGYGEATIMSKYMIYSGSAALLGSTGGFFLGCYVFPLIIWKVYDLMYGFTGIFFVFNPLLFGISTFVALLCSVGTTFISCRHELNLVAAELIRPRAPKSGKRIFLEHVTPLWKRLPFLHKVSIRNVFRYKGRFFMMLLGIGGCAGLIVTGFGIRDSITEIADEQYTRILVYDELVSFAETMDSSAMDAFYDRHADDIEQFMPICQTSVDPVGTDSIRSLTLTVLDHEENWRELLLLKDQDGNLLSYPGADEIILSANVAKVNKKKTGDMITLRDSDYRDLTFKVAGICENYFYSYGYISREAYIAAAKEEPSFKTAFVLVPKSKDLHEVSAAFMNDDDVSAVTVNADTMDMFSKMMQSLNYIVVLVISCAAALAFIVLYNLTNINITERIREIATIKVLGFYSGETATYVFRENMLLTLIGAVAGIPIGIALHSYVMSNIDIDMVTFDVHINPESYWYAIGFTIAFSLFVDFVMYFKLKRINMAESLKSIE